MAFIDQTDDALTNNFDDLGQTSCLKIASWTFSSSSVVLHLLCEHHLCLEFDCFL